MIPTEWKLIAGAVGVLALLCLIGVGVATVEKHGYDKGSAEASARYEKQIAAQVAANRNAVNEANSSLMKAADQLSMKGIELDDALAKIDASAGGPGGADPGLDAGRVRDLNAIQ